MFTGAIPLPGFITLTQVPIYTVTSSSVHMSIRTRLILIFSICLLLASGSISLIVFFSARESAQDDFHALVQDSECAAA